MDYANEIAKAALEIGAITLSPRAPYTWASGKKMPIYNDNRKHLSYLKNRLLIRDAFLDLIDKNGIEVEAISGTTTAGIAPAASVAQALGVPLNFIDKPTDPISGDWIYQHSPEFTLGLVDKIPKENCDAIVSTCPAAIPAGVFAANLRGLPFAYIRETEKKHGLQQRVEGVLKPGQRIILVDFNNQYSYVERPDYTPAPELAKIMGKGARESLEDMGLEIVSVVSEDIFPLRSGEPDLRKQKTLQIEDLVSYAGSCIGEIEKYRKFGSVVEWCLAIFSYDFPPALERFKTANVRFASASSYQPLLETAVEAKAIASDDLGMLTEWRMDYDNWGEKHGFPPEPKKA